MKKRFLKTVVACLCIPMLVGCDVNLDMNSESDSSKESSMEDAADEAASEGEADEATAEESADDTATKDSTEAADEHEDKEDASESGDEELVKQCLEGYVQYLEDNTDLWKTETVYALDYINDDDIPDLIFGDTIAVHASNIYILTYLDGNYDDVICCGAFGSYGATCYYPRLGIIFNSDMGMGYDTEYYLELSSENDYGCKTLCHRYYYYEEDYEGDPDEIKFYIGEGEDKEVTQEEYDEYVKELVGDTEYVVFDTYENHYGYEYLTQEALDNIFGW